MLPRRRIGQTLAQALSSMSYGSASAAGSTNNMDFYRNDHYAPYSQASADDYIPFDNGGDYSYNDQQSYQPPYRSSPAQRRADRNRSFPEYQQNQYHSQQYQQRQYHSQPSRGSGAWEDDRRSSQRGSSPWKYDNDRRSGTPSSRYSDDSRHHRRPSPTYTSFPSSSSNSITKRVSKENFVPHLPPPSYVEITREPLRTSEVPSHKLLVVDLNGALLYRTGRNVSAAKRMSYPRPYLHNLLAYLMLPEPNGEPSPYEVLVWSSAQPANVRRMVEQTFGPWCDGQWTRKPRLQPGEKRLLDVWARDKMNLGADFHHNVQTTKDLRDVIGELGRYDERSVLLLDDSPFKATEQPWSQIVVPEFDQNEYRRACESVDYNGPDIRDLTHESGVDAALLAVIGILEAVSHQLNIPAWIRSGAIEHPGEASADRSGQVTLESLPSAADYIHWFTTKATRQYWIAAGKAALTRKGIEVDHGMESRDQESGPGTKKERKEAARIAREEAELEAKRNAQVAKASTASPVYDGLVSISESPNVDPEQRAILDRALDVLVALGYGPSNEHTIETPLDVNRPLRLLNNAEPKRRKKKSSANTSQPVIKQPSSELDAFVKNALKRAAKYKFPTFTRPSQDVLNWMEKLKQKDFVEAHATLNQLEWRNAGNGQHLTEQERQNLVDLKARLRLVVFAPESKSYASMVVAYKRLPLPERPNKAADDEMRSMEDSDGNSPASAIPLY